MSDAGRRLREEQRIGRMALELEQRRDEVAALAKENDRLLELVARLDAQITNLNVRIEEYKRATAAGEQAVQLKSQIEQIYKESLDDAKRTIGNLTSQNRFLRKLVVVGVIAGAGLGWLLGN